jgi:peptidoglycan hydrolase CwlO-like protein
MSKTRKHLERMFLFVLFFAAPALAQFEVAPDHFPSTDELAVQPASIHAAQREQRITEQQAVVAEYRAQIKAKIEQVVAALQGLQLPTSGTGQRDALITQQRELQKLLKSLASVVRGAKVTLARLQREQAKAQSQPRHTAKHSALVAAARPGT